MKNSFHYILAPLFYISIAMSGRLFTSTGSWYQNLVKPSFTPPGSIIGVIWTIIYILTAISLIIYIDTGKNHKFFYAVISLYVVNGLINAAWSYIFFGKHLIGLAVIDAALIGITVVMMIVFTWHQSKTSSILLLPYLAWVSFATYLNYVIFRLNA